MPIKNRIIEIAYKLKDQFSAGAAKITGSFKRIEKASDKSSDAIESNNKRTARSFRSLAAGVGSLFSFYTAGKFAKAFIDTNSLLEQQTKTFESITGSAKSAANELQFVNKTAGDLGINLDATARSWSAMLAASKGTTIEGKAARDIFTSVTRAMAKMGKTSADTEGALRAIEQMLSKGKVQAEELRGQLGERLPGAFQLAARAIGVTTSELDKMLKAGEVMADELLPKLAEELDKIFDDGTKIDSFTASWTRLTNASDQALRKLNESTGILKLIGRSIDGYAGALNRFAPATRIDAIKLEIAERQKLLRIMEAQSNSVFSFFNSDINEQEIEDEKEALRGLFNELADIQKQAIKDEQESAAQQEAVARVAAHNRQKAADTDKEIGKQKLKDLKDVLKRQESIYQQHVDKIKGLLQQEQDVQKEFSNLSKELLLPSSGPEKTEDFTPRDVNAEIGDAYIAISDGDFDRALEISRKAAEMLRTMRAEGDFARLTLSGIAIDLERVGKQAAEGKTEAAIVDADKEKTEVDKITALIDKLKTDALHKEVTVPLTTDETKLNEQMAALRARIASEPIVVRVQAVGGVQTYTGENSDAGTIISNEIVARGSK